LQTPFSWRNRQPRSWKRKMFCGSDCF